MTDITATRPYGVLGRVLGHSYTPTIYKELAGLEYVRFEREPEDLAAFMTGDEWEGTNVTIPYKRAVMDYLDELSPLAERMGHPPKADKRFLQRGYVGGLFAAEPLKEFGGLETVDHRFRPCGRERGQLQRNIAQQIDENTAEPTTTADPKAGSRLTPAMVSTTSPVTMLWMSIPSRRASGWWRFMDRSSSSHACRRAPASAILSLTSPVSVLCVMSGEMPLSATG